MIKNIFFISAILSANIYALDLDMTFKEAKLDNFKEVKANLKENLKNIPQELEINHLQKLKNTSNFLIAIINDKENNALPILISKDGTIVTSIGKIFIADEKISSEIKDYVIKNIRTDNKNNNDKIKDVVSKIPDNYSVFLKSYNKNSKKEAIVITDPECPFCRENLKKELPNVLKEADIKIYFAPVHQVPSYIKAQLILNDIAKLKDQNDTKKKMEILNKYYSPNYVLSDSDKKTDYNKIETYKNIIVSSGNIGGVPFVYVYDK